MRDQDGNVFNNGIAFETETKSNRLIIKPGKNSIFLNKGKTVILVENWKFYRYRMMKRTSSLNLSCEI